MDAKSLALDTSKPYTFEFHGGADDGLVVSTDTASAIEREVAEVTLALTGNGTMGQTFMGLPMGQEGHAGAIERLRKAIVNLPGGRRGLSSPPPHFHKYTVADRQETADRVLVRLDYVEAVG